MVRMSPPVQKKRRKKEKGREREEKGREREEKGRREREKRRRKKKNNVEQEDTETVSISSYLSCFLYSYLSFFLSLSLLDISVQWKRSDLLSTFLLLPILSNQDLSPDEERRERREKRIERERKGRRKRERKKRKEE